MVPKWPPNEELNIHNMKQYVIKQSKIEVLKVFKEGKLYGVTALVIFNLEIFEFGRSNIVVVGRLCHDLRKMY